MGISIHVDLDDIVKLLNCDFAGPVWKEEIIHGVGFKNYS